MEICENCLHYSACLINSEYVPSVCAAYKDKTDVSEDVVPREEHEELIYKLECLLCCASGGKLSKHTYDLKTMETVVNDYINESYYDGAKDTAKEIFHEIFEIIKKYEFDALAAKENYGVFQVHNFGCDIMKLREKYGITDTAPKE